MNPINLSELEKKALEGAEVRKTIPNVPIFIEPRDVLTLIIALHEAVEALECECCLACKIIHDEALASIKKKVVFGEDGE